MSNAQYIDKTVLVLEADQNQKRLFCDILYQLGFPPDNIACADALKTAIESLTVGMPDIIFIDMMTCLDTEHDGYSICTLIKEARGVKAPVFLTSYINDVFGPLRSLALKVQGVVQKPVNFLDLKRIVDRNLRILELEKELFDQALWGSNG